MCRKLIVSLSLVLGLSTLIASAQQPGQPQPKTVEKSAPGQPPGKGTGQPGEPGQPKKAAGDKEPKKADPTEALVQAALATDPDVKLAQAKVQLAEAELGKARQAIALRVLSLNTTIEDLKGQVDVHAKKVAMDEKAAASGQVAMADLLADRLQLEHAKSALAKAELEMKFITGASGLPGAAANTNQSFPLYSLQPFNNSGLTTSYNAWVLPQLHSQVNPQLWDSTTGTPLYFNPIDSATNQSAAPAKGSIPERIRSALDKPVKLAPKGEQVGFLKAIEVFKKDAGLDVPVRYAFKMESIVSEGEELPVGAWFQLFTDTTPGARIVIRDYGLLVTAEKEVPPSAIPLSEFWKRPIKKEPEVKPASDQPVPKR
jgi:hypothetical protein